MVLIVVENYDIVKLKTFFVENYSHIYFLFHEGFTNVEQSLTQRGTGQTMLL